jgi:predicted kinase
MSFYLVVRGPLGVGKSTVSAAIARSLGADHVPIDRILEEHDLEEWDDDRISLRSFLRANEFAGDLARGSFARGRPVVFDGCFYWREQLDDLVRRLDVPHLIFTLEAPLSVCAARDRTRPLPRPEGPRGGDQLGAEAAAAVFKLVADAPCGTPVDATGSVEATVAAILAQLADLVSHP